MADRQDRLDNYQVKVLDKAIDILECFTIRRTDLGVADIVEVTGLNRSTVTRILANLERRGLVEQAPARYRYRLGRRILEMGDVVSSSYSLPEAAAEPLARLEERSVGTVLLAERHGDHAVIVDRRQGKGGTAMASMPGDIGTVQPLTFGPIGHVVLASLPPAAVDDILSRYPLPRQTPFSIVDRAVFLERLADIKSKGYSLEVNEIVEGLMGVAAPVFGSGGAVVGAVSVGFSITRENDEDFLADTLANLRQAATELSANLGYVEPEAAEPEAPKAAAEAEAPARSA